MATTNACLWLAPDVAPEAVALYTRLVPGSRVLDHQRFEHPEGHDYDAETWTLELAGQRQRVMGAAHAAGATTAVSMWLELDDQAAIDRVWQGFLDAGGAEQECGWITDPFGIMWQVVPTVFDELTSGEDHSRAQRAVEAVWQMKKIDVARLEEAARG